jgi:hypothetical protein
VEGPVAAAVLETLVLIEEVLVAVARHLLGDVIPLLLCLQH